MALFNKQKEIYSKILKTPLTKVNNRVYDVINLNTAKYNDRDMLFECITKES